MSNKTYLYLSLLFFISSSTLYNVNIICDTCMLRTDCSGNKCLIFTGDISGEFCSLSATCAFTFQQNIQMGQCFVDTFTNTTCSTGMCAAKSSLSMCYTPANGVCPATQIITRTCSSSIMTVTTSATTPVSYSMTNPPMPWYCYFTSQSE